ncbi:hypothetical protein BWI17_05920 [Betaproteobacteria bacterium GR16-43]|nr:hypothetical protein BWI17_05920 [Betaproteobacteria bacterium GR16-43]
MTTTHEPGRGDRVLFYAAAVSSFLETSVPLYTRELRRMFDADPEFLQWLDETWEPEESGHGLQMRELLARRWPEYRWEDAYAAFLAEYTSYCGPHLLRATPARELLSRCVTECQAAMLYRALSAYSSDPEISTLFRHMYEDEVRHYKVFFREFRRYRAAERLGAIEVTRALFGRRGQAQAEDAGTALRYVNYGYSRDLPFAPLEADGATALAREALRAHFPSEPARRMLLKPLEETSAAGRWIARGVGLAMRLEGQQVV